MIRIFFQQLKNATERIEQTIKDPETRSLFEDCNPARSFVKELGFQEAKDNTLVAPPSSRMKNVQGARDSLYALWWQDDESKCVLM